MRALFFELFGYLVFFYSALIIIAYTIMMILAGKGIFKRRRVNLNDYDKNLIFNSPYTPGVSIIAGAYNEENSIIENVKSMFKQSYPEFEVVIVNDGSKDKTLEKMIETFNLIEVPYDYIQKIYTQPVLGVYVSQTKEFEKLKVVNKQNGGTKADAINAGINIASYPYFINTDVDCILSHDAILNCILPVLRNKDVIAVSGAMTMANGCKIENGELLSREAPRTLVPLFQTYEYLRSFFLGKMAWSSINAMPNVSGGYGLFHRDVMISAGGYRSDSFAEDMEMILDAITYCCNFNRKYRILQIPITCCWTEGCPTLKVLYRQRKRWGRGLVQTFFRHRKMIYNPKYRQMGMITLPFIFMFELLGPIIEFFGLIFTIYLAITGGVNWSAAIVIFLALYTFCLMLGVVVLIYDYISGSTFDHAKQYLKVAVAIALEGILYHPFVVLFSLIGYGDFILQTRATWGNMTRAGFAKGGKNAETVEQQPS